MLGGHLNEGVEAKKALCCLEGGGEPATLPICLSTSLRRRPNIWEVTLGGHSRWQSSPEVHSRAGGREWQAGAQGWR